MDEENINIEDEQAQEVEGELPERGMLPLDEYLQLPMGARLEIAKRDRDVK